MGIKKAVTLSMALILGLVLAVVVGSWQEQRVAPQADGHSTIQATAPAPSSHQPEFLAETPSPASSARGSASEGKTDQAGVVPASYEAPELSPAETTPPALLPADGSPADEMPAELAPGAEESPAEEAPPEEKPAAEAPAEEKPADDPARADAPAAANPLTFAWLDDYGQAMDAAIEQQRMMLIYFCDLPPTQAQQAFERQSQADPKNREMLARDFVPVKLPTRAVIIRHGKPLELLKHPAFSEMLGRPGVAIVDFAHPRSEYFGHVVSTFPFISGRYYSRPVLSIVLGLPPGTLTQRTMVYAVRVHPEAPASTQGQFHNVLADEANRQSIYQAAILVQGHQNWDSRVQRISTRLPGVGGAQEVVAESWPSESLVEASVDCVDSWHHSPGHWEAVRTRHPLFGFDIQRGRNGIWYATGIFGHR